MPQVYCRTIDGVEWANTLDQPGNQQAAAHIWRLRISSNTGMAEMLYLLLSPAEIDRADSYHHQRDRIRFILSRGALRMLLAAYTATSPADIQLVVGKNKRPLLLHNGNNDLYYNLAHAGDFIVFIFSATPAGIDIEYTGGGFFYDDVLKDCFSEQEQLFVINHRSPRSAFYELWTRKEALVKATSKGIDDDIKMVPCLDGTHEVERAITASDKNWNLSSIDVSDGYPAAVACESSILNLLFFEAENFVRGLK